VREVASLLSPETQTISRREAYKIVKGVYDKRVTENILPLNQNIHQNTRGHSL